MPTNLILSGVQEDFKLLAVSDTWELGINAVVFTHLPHSCTGERGWEGICTLLCICHPERIQVLLEDLSCFLLHLQSSGGREREEHFRIEPLGLGAAGV